MLPSPLQHMRHLLLISLMTLVLGGVQALQASPLHEHASHAVDCALCHLQLSDDALFEQASALASVGPISPCLQFVATYHSFTNPSPYQGRAPPLFSR